jgi:hypothetical protein
VGRRLPALQGAALIRLYARRLNPHKNLPAALGTGHGPMRHEVHVALLDPDAKVRWQRSSAGGARHLGRTRAKNLLEEGPRVWKNWPIVLLRQKLTRRLAIGASLLIGVQPITREDHRLENKARRLNMADPFAVRVGRCHVQLLSGQR